MYSSTKSKLFPFKFEPKGKGDVRWIDASTGITISLFLTSQIHTKTPEEYGFSATSNSFHIKPTTLLTPYRFDIIAKYIYAKHREKNVRNRGFFILT